MAANDDLVDAKIAASEARSETKIARLEGKLDLVLSKLDANFGENKFIRQEIADSRRAVITNGWVIAASVVAVIAILSQLFDLGFKMRETIGKDVDEKVKTIQRSAPQQSGIKSGPPVVINAKHL